ncbi:MAG: hypothetical protein M1825_001524 [Sarcosagium campestre]|nr:MAG: hypothetical protein M1825_001524 [Sarcosagium campestre]
MTDTTDPSSSKSTSSKRKRSPPSDMASVQRPEKRVKGDKAKESTSKPKISKPKETKSFKKGEKSGGKKKASTAIADSLPAITLSDLVDHPKSTPSDAPTSTQLNGHAPDASDTAVSSTAKRVKSSSKKASSSSKKTKTGDDNGENSHSTSKKRKRNEAAEGTSNKEGQKVDTTDKVEETTLPKKKQKVSKRDQISVELEKKSRQPRKEKKASGDKVNATAASVSESATAESATEAETDTGTQQADPTPTGDTAPAMPASELFTANALAGKQLWHITVPAGIPIESLSTLDLDKARKGTANFSDGKQDFNVSTEVNQIQEKEKCTILIADSNGKEYKQLSKDFTETLAVKLDVNLPNLFNHNLSNGYVRPHSVQPEGLRMRLLPRAFFQDEHAGQNV